MVTFCWMKLSWLPQIPALSLCHTIYYYFRPDSKSLRCSHFPLAYSFTWLSGASNVEYEEDSKWITLTPQGHFLKRWNCELSYISNKKTPGALGIVKSIYGDSFHWAGRGGNGGMSQENKQPLLIFMSEWLFNAFNGNLNLDSFLSLLYQQLLNYCGRKAWQRVTTAWLETKVNTLPVTPYLSY